MLEIVPMTLREANAFVEQNHRHHGATVGHKFSIGLSDGEKIVGIAIVGRPVSRHLDDGWTLEVNRLCTDGTRNACSMLYAAACIAVRVVLAHGTGSSVKYFDPDTLQENFKAIDKHREDEDRAIISDWVNLNGPEYCRKQVEAIWKQGG